MKVSEAPSNAQIPQAEQFESPRLSEELSGAPLSPRQQVRPEAAIL